MKYRSYPKSSGMSGDPAHKSPVIAVNVDWVEEYGNRAQRRRIKRELSKQSRKKSQRG